jgi:hypothetical protein
VVADDAWPGTDARDEGLHMPQGSREPDASDRIEPIPLTDERVRRAIRCMDRVKARWLSFDEVDAVDVGFKYEDQRLVRPVEVCVRVHVTGKRPKEELQPYEIFGEAPGRSLPADCVEAGVGFDVIEAFYDANERRPERPGRPGGDGDDRDDSDDSDDADRGHGDGPDDRRHRHDRHAYGCHDHHLEHAVTSPQEAMVDVVPDRADPYDTWSREQRRRHHERREDRRDRDHALAAAEAERRGEDPPAPDDPEGEPDGCGPDHRDARYDRRARTTPLLGGISVGNPRTSAGTLGAIVWDLEDGAPCILSNWHILAGSVPPAGGDAHTSGRGVPEPHYHALSGAEPHYHGAGPEPHYHGAGPEPHYHGAGPEPHYHGAGPEPHYHGAGPEPHYHGAGPEPHYHPAGRAPYRQAAARGELVYQPGRFDGGTVEDTVALLTRSCLDRRMDAAIARLTGSRAAWPTLLGLPSIGGSREPRLGATVYKSGRTTGVTRGIIDGVALTTTIDFPHGSQTFEHQLRIAPHPDDRSGDVRIETSEPGDSGAVWVDADGWLAVGLHFGGDVLGSQESEHSLANPIRCVEEELGFSFTPVPRRVAPRPPAPAGRVGLRGALDEVLRIAAQGGASGPGARAELEALRAAADDALGRRGCGCGCG